MRPPVTFASLLAVLVGCSSLPSEPAPELPRSAGPEGPRYGALMAEIGPRFERAGRAAGAGAWELADYDLHELEELFEDDAPGASAPADVTTDLPGGMADFARGPLAELRRAAASHDGAAFASAYAAAAGACNACHRDAGRGFLLIPTVQGEEVPAIAPPAPAADPGQSDSR